MTSKKIWVKIFLSTHPPSLRSYWLAEAQITMRFGFSAILRPGSCAFSEQIRYLMNLLWNTQTLVGKRSSGGRKQEGFEKAVLTPWI